MGEIGITRHDFLYDIQFWEVRRIIRGYRKRNRLIHQLLAECVYATVHVMRDPEGKRVEDFFPDIFKEEEYTEEEIAESDLTDEEFSDLQGLIDSLNSKKE